MYSSKRGLETDSEIISVFEMTISEMVQYCNHWAVLSCDLPPDMDTCTVRKWLKMHWFQSPSTIYSRTCQEPTKKPTHRVLSLSLNNNGLKRERAL
jgi:hypothetical protein